MYCTVSVQDDGCQLTGEACWDILNRICKTNTTYASGICLRWQKNTQIHASLAYNWIGHNTPKHMPNNTTLTPAKLIAAGIMMEWLQHLKENDRTNDANACGVLQSCRTTLRSRIVGASGICLEDSLRCCIAPSHMPEQHDAHTN